MKITPRFNTTMKWLLLFAIVMTIINTFLSAKGMRGISLTNLAENTPLRLFMHHSTVLMGYAAFWAAVGYLTDDFKSAIPSLIASTLIHFILFIFFPISQNHFEQSNLPTILRFFSGIIPWLIFGQLHNKSEGAYKFILIWAITTGLVIGSYSLAFPRLLSTITSIFGIRDPFSFNVSMEEAGRSRQINIFMMLCGQFILIVNVCIFWWIYHFLKTKQSFLTAIQTCFQSATNSKLVFSAVYWSLRSILFITGLGVVTGIADTFRSPLSLMTIIKVIAAFYSLLVVASIYRNFLTAHLTKHDKHPGFLYFFLNIPLLNLFAWIVSLRKMAVSDSEELFISNNRIQKVTSQFLNINRNSSIKIILIIISIASFAYLTYRGGSNVILIFSGTINLILIIWFLTSKSAYHPLLIICGVSLLIAAVARDKALLQPAMATGIVNLVVYYALFYFDELKWMTNDNEEFVLEQSPQSL